MARAFYIQGIINLDKISCYSIPIKFNRTETTHRLKYLFGSFMPKDKKLESSLRFLEDLKNRWMATVDAIPDPLMIIDRNYNIIKGNKALAQLEGTEVKSLQKKKCYQAFAGRNSPCPGCLVQEAFNNTTRSEFELDGIRKNKFHEVTAQPITTGYESVESVVTIYRDRTEAKHLRSQLIQKEKLASIGLLAGGIAHELNNPLGGIMIFSQMLLREMPKDNKYREDVVEIEAAAQRCKEIVSSLLDFARAQPTQVQSLEIVDIPEAMKAALKFAMVGYIGGHIETHFDWQAEDAFARGSRNKVIQLFLNLIQNAIQAMPKEGTLTLKSRNSRRKNQVIYEVQDTGIGIPKSRLNNIFDPFYTSKAKGDGTGLGLSICHGIAEEMQGEITVSSKTGKGSTFKITLPRSVDAKKTSA